LDEAPCVSRLVGKAREGRWCKIPGYRGWGLACFWSKLGYSHLDALGKARLSDQAGCGGGGRLDEGPMSECEDLVGSLGPQDQQSEDHISSWAESSDEPSLDVCLVMLYVDKPGLTFSFPRSSPRFPFS